MTEDMFEKFVNNKLPPEIKAQLECCADVHAGNNSNKWWFTVGFFMAMRIDEIRKELGIED